MDSVAIWNSVLVTIKMAICVLGILANGLVIFTILKNISRLSAPCYFVLSIAVSDFLSCAVAVPISISSHFQKTWPFGMAGCKAHAFMIFLFALVSIFHLAAISVGKYLTIIRSLSRDSYFTKRQVLGIIMGLWMYALGFTMGPLLGWSRYGPEGTNATCSIQWRSSLPADRAYYAVVFITCFLLPVAVITFCYYKIHKVTKRIVHNTLHVTGLAMTMNQALVKKQHRSAFYFLGIITGFLVCWTPYAIVSFISVLGRKLHPIALSAPSVFAKTSFLLDPILYAFLSRRFRRRVLLAIPISKSNRAVRPRAWPSDSVVL